MKKQYWFYIDSYVHLSLKKEEAVLYNPNSAGILHYRNNSTVLKLLRRMTDPRNMWVVKLTEKDLENPVIRAFVKDIRKHFMGDLLDTRFSKSKPMQMVPHVKLQKSVDLLKKDSYRSIGENILTYLSEVFIYLNDRCEQNCTMCSTVFLQHPCCTAKQTGKTEFDGHFLEQFIKDTAYAQLAALHLIGGDLTLYSNWSRLAALLDSMPYKKYTWIHYLNAAARPTELYRLKLDNCRVKMPIGFPIQVDELNRALESFDKLQVDVVPVFFITGDDEFRETEKFLEETAIENVEFIPVYNGKNLDFFETNFFIAKEDIANIKPDPKMIYTNQTANSMDFGKLVIMPDGRVYSNVNNSPLGRLSQTSIRDMLYKELSHKKSWRLTRADVNPCKSCAFQYICPPISNYNRAMERYDLCFIRKEQ